MSSEVYAMITKMSGLTVARTTCTSQGRGMKTFSIAWRYFGFLRDGLSHYISLAVFRNFSKLESSSCLHCIQIHLLTQNATFNIEFDFDVSIFVSVLLYLHLIGKCLNDWISNTSALTKLKYRNFVWTHLKMFQNDALFCAFSLLCG